MGLAQDAKPTVEFVECDNSIDQVVRERLTLKVSIMASALNDSSLRVDPNVFEYDDGETDIDDITNNLSVDDAKAVLEYFFNGGSDD